MANLTQPAPRKADLRICPRCMAPPQIFRAEQSGKDLWVISCPDCALLVAGKRVEGLCLANRDLVEVTKPGDMFDETVGAWNGLKAADGSGKKESESA
jgi:hypothetical protein